jgi:hypothetical protein
MAVINSVGKVVMEPVIETKASMILQFIDGLAEIYRSLLKKERRPLVVGNKIPPAGILLVH